LKNSIYKVFGTNYEGIVDVPFRISSYWNHEILTVSKQVSGITCRVLDQKVKFIKRENFKFMAISLKVLAPNKNVYQGEAEEVILPSTTGQLGVLPGHISLVTAIDIGVLRLRMNSQWKSIALMGGFAEIESDEVIVLVNNGEIGSEINVQNAEQDLKEAKLAISKFSENEKNAQKIKALKEISKAEARVQAAKN